MGSKVSLPRLLNPSDYSVNWTLKSSTIQFTGQTTVQPLVQADPRRWALKFGFINTTGFQWGFTNDLGSGKGLVVNNDTGHRWIELNYATDGGFVESAVYVYNQFGISDFVTIYEMLWIPKV